MLVAAYLTRPTAYYLPTTYSMRPSPLFYDPTPFSTSQPFFSTHQPVLGWTPGKCTWGHLGGHMRGTWGCQVNKRCQASGSHANQFSHDTVDLKKIKRILFYPYRKERNLQPIQGTGRQVLASIQPENKFCYGILLRRILRRYRPQSAVSCSAIWERTAGSSPSTNQVNLEVRIACPSGRPKK